jgi:Sulfotransferase family
MTSTAREASSASVAVAPACQVSVLYVMGWGRSGSTLLGNLLGELDGFFHAGELRTIWTRGFRGRRLCGCGVPVDRCPFWTDVWSHGFEDRTARVTDPGRVAQIQRQVVRARHSLKLLRQGPGRPLAPALEEYASITARLYHAIADVSGARVIVDTSKRPTDGMALGVLSDIQPHFVQLVRDPRAVAYSWSRVKGSPGEGRRQEMLRYGTVTSTRNWLWFNAVAEIVRRRHETRSLLLRYEDLVEYPRSAVELVAALVGEHPAASPFIDQRSARLGSNHTAGGNPNRLSREPVTIQVDAEWIADQPIMQRFTATAISSPLLRRYGYQLRPATRAATGLI